MGFSFLGLKVKMKMKFSSYFLAFCGFPSCRPFTGRPITYLFVRCLSFCSVLLNYTLLYKYEPVIFHVHSRRLASWAIGALVIRC